MSGDMKLCPHCGSEPRLQRKVKKEHVLYYVECSNWDCHCNTGMWPHKDRVIEDWNQKEGKAMGKSRPGRCEHNLYGAFCVVHRMFNRRFGLSLTVTRIGSTLRC